MAQIGAANGIADVVSAGRRRDGPARNSCRGGAYAAAPSSCVGGAHAGKAAPPADAVRCADTGETDGCRVHHHRFHPPVPGHASGNEDAKDIEMLTGCAGKGLGAEVDEDEERYGVVPYAARGSSCGAMLAYGMSSRGGNTVIHCPVRLSRWSPSNDPPQLHRGHHFRGDHAGKEDATVGPDPMQHQPTSLDDYTVLRHDWQRSAAARHGADRYVKRSSSCGDGTDRGEADCSPWHPTPPNYVDTDLHLAHGSTSHARDREHCDDEGEEEDDIVRGRTLYHLYTPSNCHCQHQGKGGVRGRCGDGLDRVRGERSRGEEGSYMQKAWAPATQTHLSLSAPQAASPQPSLRKFPRIAGPGSRRRQRRHRALLRTTLQPYSMSSPLSRSSFVTCQCTCRCQL